MEMGIILLVVVVLGVGLVVRRKKNWKTLQTATGPNSELLQTAYAHLKSNHVKCKLVTDSSAVGDVGVGIVQSVDILPRDGTVFMLKVHTKHMEQAKELLEEFPEAV
ncbi:hypothetical protein [Cohnella soli]|uniref:DUF2007 domain-containing protein n=1 Tax=Cohnella soli TaxID=425005 RepID=A0ABW0I0P8_9BACL